MQWPSPEFSCARNHLEGYDEGYMDDRRGGGRVECGREGFVIGIGRSTMRGIDGNRIHRRILAIDHSKSVETANISVPTVYCPSESYASLVPLSTPALNPLGQLNSPPSAQPSLLSSSASIASVAPRCCVFGIPGLFVPSTTSEVVPLLFSPALVRLVGSVLSTPKGLSTRFPRPSTHLPGCSVVSNWASLVP